MYVFIPLKQSRPLEPQLQCDVQETNNTHMDTKNTHYSCGSGCSALSIFFHISNHCSHCLFDLKHYVLYNSINC